MDNAAVHSAVPESFEASAVVASVVAVVVAASKAAAFEVALTGYPADLAAGSSKVFVVVAPAAASDVASVVVVAAAAAAAAAVPLTQQSVAFDVAFVPMKAAPHLCLCSHYNTSPCH